MYMHDVFGRRMGHMHSTLQVLLLLILLLVW
jgi:hypothetical protein